MKSMSPVCNGEVMGRECGDCTLCCKLLGVKELNKPAHEWCKHCDIGKGCRIYTQRPNECQNFTCMWWAGMTPEELKPDKVHAVFTMTGDKITVDVDKHRKDVIEKGVVKEYVDLLLKNGKRVEIYV